MVTSAKATRAGRPAGAAQRGEQRRLADAIAVRQLQHARGAEDFRIGIVEIGVVADLARREIEAPRLLGRGRIGRHGLRGERPDRRMIAVDELGRRQIDVVHCRYSKTLHSVELTPAAAASRSTGRSRIGKCTKAAKMPSATPSHQTAS